jgi:hypothetical protein
MIDDYHLQNLTTSSSISLFTGSGALPGLAPYRNTRTPNHNIINKSDNAPQAPRDFEEARQFPSQNADF